MCLSNYNLYSREINPNYIGLNMLSTVYSVTFCILNCYLGGLVIEDIRIKGVLTILIFGLLEYIIIDVSFNSEDLTSHSYMAIAIAIIYTLILVPLFGRITNSI